jgi:hypothetical protein
MGKVEYGDILIDLIRAEGGGKFAEIGVERGKTCRELLRSCGDIITEYWAIDPWDIVKSGSRKNWSQKRWFKCYLYCCRLMIWFPQLKVIKMTSKQASIMFPDGYFDMVFIDGDHSYEMAKFDILCWKALLREDGLLIGHDYDSIRYPGVVRAVDEVLGKVDLFSHTLWTHRGNINND